MKAKEQTLAELLAGTVVHVTPSFQRAYGGPDGVVAPLVGDDGEICGVEGEYALADRGKSNWDGWQLRLVNVLRSRLAPRNAILRYAVERRRAGEHDVCLVRVQPSDEPVYVDKRLYVRTFNQTVEMVGPDLVDFVARRFPKPGP